jgi:hypothetical protein
MRRRRDHFLFLAMITLWTTLGVIAIPRESSGAIIGKWTFEGGSLLDSTGNFGTLQLQGTASIANGELIVSSTVSSVTGWARTGTYGGPTITNKTLVSWITLTSLTHNKGSAITIDRIGNNDQFDGIVFGERQTNRWMSGSSNFSRTQDFSPGFQETMTGTKIQLAFTYSVSGSSVTITGYRNGILLGQYTSSNAESWSTNDAEVIFGARHAGSTTVSGGLNARIDEARIYNEVLTQSQIAGLTLTPIPEPSSLAIFCMGSLGVILRKFPNKRGRRIDLTGGSKRP